MIVLYESELKTRLLPVAAIVNLRKKPPGVAVFLRNYDLDRWDSGLFYLHHGPRPCRPTGPRRRSSCQKPRRAATSNRKWRCAGFQLGTEIVRQAPYYSLA